MLVIAALATASTPFAAKAARSEQAGQEKVVQFESLPPGARATILREANGAAIIKVEFEQRDGKTLYEAHVKQGSDEMGILVDGKGTLIDKHLEKDEHEERKEARSARNPS